MKLRQAVNDKELWDEFLEELDRRIELAQGGLITQTELPALYREQGKVHALTSLKRLREELNTDKPRSK
jgi:hypothetical protein